MRSRAPALEVREMHTVFAELFAAKFRHFATHRPNPSECLVMLQDTIIVLRGYEEALDSLLSQQRAQARHDCLPDGDGSDSPYPRL